MVRTIDPFAVLATEYLERRFSVDIPSTIIHTSALGGALGVGDGRDKHETGGKMCLKICASQ